MSAENNKLVNVDETQNTKQMVNRSRRSFAKVGVAVPAMMSLASRTALGSPLYECTPSGHASGNQSSHPNQDPSKCKTGTSPQAWADQAHNNDGTTSGGSHQWKSAGACPTAINIDNKATKITKIEYCDKYYKVIKTDYPSSSPKTFSVGGKKYRRSGVYHDDSTPSVCDPVVSRWGGETNPYNDPNPQYATGDYAPYTYPGITKIKYKRETQKSVIESKTTTNATLCSDILGQGAPNDECYQVLKDGPKVGDVACEALAVYFNCMTGQGPEGVTGAMVKELYACYKNGAGSFTTASGITLTPAGCGEFLKTVCPT